MENIRVIVKNGKYAGKNIVILAGVHGNEICGVKAFDELIPKIEIEKGRVTFIYANIEAQKQNKRFTEKNLNRCFLDEQSEEIANTLEGKTAKAIIPFLKRADILLDIHSSKSCGDGGFFICEEDCLELVFCLSPKKVILGTYDVEKGSTNGYMYNSGKLGICIECGLHESEDSVKIAKETIIDIFKKLEMINGENNKFDNKEIYRVKYLYKNKKGVFRLSKDLKLFKEVEERTLIGYDGGEEVYVEKGDVVIFAHETNEIGKECFMILRSCPWR